MDENNKTATQKLCPTCGSRVSDTALKCPVCGRNLTQPVPAAKTKSAGVNEPRLPEITLNLPIALGILILVLAVGAIITFFALKATGSVAQPTEAPTSTITPTSTNVPTETPTFTPQPTPTLLPPIEYSIKAGDSCLLLAAVYQNISREYRRPQPPATGLRRIERGAADPDPPTHPNPLTNPILHAVLIAGHSIRLPNAQLHSAIRGYACRCGSQLQRGYRSPA